MKDSKKDWRLSNRRPTQLQLSPAFDVLGSGSAMLHPSQPKTRLTSFLHWLAKHAHPAVPNPGTNGAADLHRPMKRCVPAHPTRRDSCATTHITSNSVRHAQAALTQISQIINQIQMQPMLDHSNKLTLNYLFS